jgi:Striatin family
MEDSAVRRGRGSRLILTRKAPSTHCRVWNQRLLPNIYFLTWHFFITGVMRFLQTEWHRHERDRNAWEIERAEMKSRIGRLEGDIRTSKRLHESLGKHVKMLELALKKEREVVRSLRNGEKMDEIRDPKEIAKESLKALSNGQFPSVSLYLLKPFSKSWLVLTCVFDS